MHLQPEITPRPAPTEGDFQYKNNLPVLNSYRGSLPNEYWDRFPYREPVGGIWRARTVDNFKYHEIIMKAMSQGMYKGIITGPNEPEISDNFIPPLVTSVLDDLLVGANLHFDRFKFRELNNCIGQLGAIVEEDNSPQLECKKEGSIFADYLFSGLKNNMFLGPFKYPLKYLPVIEKRDGKIVKKQNFPITLSVFNKLFILRQNAKYRIITDLSSPKNKSINDCIDSDVLRSLEMSTIPKIFKRIRDIGKKCTISKRF